MASFSFTNSTEVPDLQQRVWINGALRSDVFGLTVSLGMGTNGTQASFTIPSASWDDDKTALHNQEVWIDVRHVGESNWKRVFNGNIVGISANAGQVIDFEAQSLIAQADSIPLGSPTYGFEIGYPQRALKNGIMTETGWTVKSILADLFSSSQVTWRNGGKGNGNIDSEVRAILKLGTTSTLSSSYNNLTLGDLFWQQITLRDALDELLGLVSTVSFKERFEGGHVYLDFFELGSDNAPVKDCSVAEPGESIQGTNIATISVSQDIASVRTKLTVQGDNRKFPIYLNEANGGLVPDWSSSLEANVLANLESVKKGQGSEEGLRDEFSAAKAKVFREYRISSDFENLLIDTDNALELSDGTKLPIQVFKEDTTPVPAGDGSFTFPAKSGYTLLEGAEIDIPNRRITLKAPCVKIVGASVEVVNTAAPGEDPTLETVPVLEYEEANLFCTLTVNGPRLSYTANESGILQGRQPAEVIVNPSFGYIQTTNQGYPINGKTYGCIYTPDKGETWVNPGLSVIQDDSQALQTFANLALDEKSRIKVSYQIDFPFFTTHYRLGERIRIVNGVSDFDYGTHQITSISHNLTNGQQMTSISTDNSVPLIANQILGS